MGRRRSTPRHATPRRQPSPARPALVAGEAFQRRTRPRPRLPAFFIAELTRPFRAEYAKAVTAPPVSLFLISASPFSVPEEVSPREARFFASSSLFLARDGEDYERRRRGN